MKLTRCDRCKKDVPSGQYTVFKIGPWDASLELCEQCFQSFEAFLGKDIDRSRPAPRPPD